MDVLAKKVVNIADNKDETSTDEQPRHISFEEFSRNEKVFMHSVLIFKLSFHTIAKSDASSFKSKYEKFVEMMSDVCNLPTFDYRRRDILLTQVDKRCKRYSHSIILSVVNTEGMENIASEKRGDRVFLRFSTPNTYASIELYQSEKNGKWMPNRELMNKYYDNLIIHLKSKHIEEDPKFRIEVMLSKIETIKEAVSETFGILLNKKTIGCHTQKFSSLHPQDEDITFKFTYNKHLIQVCLQLQWILRVSLLKGGYSHFAQNRALHCEMIEQFLRWKWRTAKDSSHCVCDLKNMSVLVHERSIPLNLRRKNEGWKYPYKLSDVGGVLGTLNGEKLKTLFKNPEFFCVCNEWCNIHSFYFHNPIARFVLCQNQKLFVVPQHLIAPYHFLSLSNIISQKNIHCIGLFSSCIEMIKEYIAAINADELSTLRKYFWDTYAGGIIREAYHNIRRWLVKPESFKIVKSPFDEYSSDFLCFVKEILWLSSNESMKDPKLTKKLRFKLQDILVYWVDFVLENPTMHIDLRLMIIDYYLSSNTSPLKFTEKSTSSGKVFVRKSLILIVKEKDKRRENKEQLIASIERKKDSRLSVIIECSHTLSLIHKMHSFIASADNLIPFYVYDKQLFKSESEMAQEIDSSFAHKVNKDGIKITLIKNTEEDGSRDALFTHYYVVMLYSIALDIQTFIVKHIAYTFNVEFAFDYPLEEISFFVSNDWIEHIAILSLGDSNLNKLFTSTEDIRATVDTQFDQFYKEYWIPFANEPDTPEKKFVYDCACFLHWLKSEKNDENDPFISVSRELNNIISQCVTNAELYLAMNISEIDADSTTGVDIEKCKQLQTKYTIKAFFYNIICITAVIAQKCLTLLRKSEVESFVGIIPVWVPLLNLYAVIKRELQDFTGKHCKSKKDKTVYILLPTILDHVNSIFCLVYVHLCNRFVAYIIRFRHQKELLKLLTLIIYPILNRFKFQFSSVYRYNTQRVDSALISLGKSEERNLTQFIKKCKDMEFESKDWQQAFGEQLNSMRNDFETCLSVAYKWNIHVQRVF